MEPPQNLECQPAASSGMADYQKGSIVSKKIIQKEAGNVTFFAFDQGQELSEHTSPYDAFVQVVDGEAEIAVSGKPFRVTAGQTLLMPAGQPHALKAVKRFKMILTLMRSDVVK